MTAVADGSAGSLAEIASRYDCWWRVSALPVWWCLGADHTGGGFHDSLNASGRPSSGPRRARVQARQIYTFARAGSAGWAGPWRAAMDHGLVGFAAGFRRGDGLYRTRASDQSGPEDDNATLYDNAFALLALASVAAADPGRPVWSEGEALLYRVREQFGHVNRGFREAASRPYQSNPQMHLLEAALAWEEAGGGATWHELADELVELCLTRLIDKRHGFIREFYDDLWASAPDEAGRLVEPGHQFEWAWLLVRWSLSRGGVAPAQDAARRLHAVGLLGVDAGRGVAIDALDDDLRPLSARARLWPQTEWLKASLILSETEGGQEGRYRASAVQASAGLWSYLRDDNPGLWRDKLGADGAFVDEPAPASSLYHLTEAVLELARLALPRSP